jgi:hypothetical protein
MNLRHTWVVRCSKRPALIQEIKCLLGLPAAILPAGSDFFEGLAQAGCGKAPCPLAGCLFCSLLRKSYFGVHPDGLYHRDLRDYEPMAWDFCLNFAKDNNLQVAEACLIPDEPAR